MGIFRWVVLKNFAGAMFFGDLPNRANGKRGIWMGAGKDQIINLHEYFTLEELESSVAIRQALKQQPNEEVAKLVTLEKGVTETPLADASSSVDTVELDTLKEQLSSMATMLSQMQQIMAQNQQQVIYSEPPPQPSQAPSDNQSDLLKQILSHVKSSGSKELVGFSELNADEVAIKIMGKHSSDRTSNFSDIGKSESIKTNASDVAKELSGIDFDMSDDEE